MEFWGTGYRISVNIPNWASLEAEVSQKLASGQGFALATINLDHLVKLRSDQRFRAAYEAQDLVVADGNPIVWLSKIAKQPVELIPGSDAVMPLIRLAAKQGKRIAFFGSTDETLRLAKTHVEREVPEVKICATVSPPFGFDPRSDAARASLEELDAAKADIVFLALGAPKQEVFAAFGKEVLPRVGFVSIGASLDFFAGSQKRAPAWVRSLALEWVWRAALSPMRLVPRYAKCIAILPRECAHAWKLRRRVANQER